MFANTLFMKLRAFLIIFSLHLAARADEPMDNRIYDDAVGNIMLHRVNEPENPLPFIILNSGEQLRLAFDLFGSSGDYLQFTLQHCDAAWKPSNLQVLQYLDGTLQGQISIFTSSRNTYAKYQHFESLVPASDMKVKYSGNYILKVFRNFDENELVFTRRIMILQPNYTLNMTARSATSAELRKTHQEIDFVVGYKGFRIVNPNGDVNAVILQNYNWANAITLHKPFTFNNAELNYNFEKENTFEAGNEFRYFDTRSLRFGSVNVAKKEIDSITHVYLKADEIRAGKSYLQYGDFNGKAVIANKDGTDVGRDGDYAWYYFTLNAPEAFEEDVYVIGQLSNWQLDEQFKCTYNAEKKAYELNAFLKQGYYNYQYVTVDAAGQVSYARTEGNSSDAENDYTVLIYTRNIQYGYDELVALETKNTRVR